MSRHQLAVVAARRPVPEPGGYGVAMTDRHAVGSGYRAVGGVMAVSGRAPLG